MEILENHALKHNISRLIWFRFFKWGDLIVVIEPLFFIATGLTFSDYLKLMAIWMFLTFLLEVPSGALADLIGRKKILIISQISQIFQYSIYIFANTFFGFLIAKILGAITYAFQSGTDSALLYDSVKAVNLENEFKKINGKKQFMFYLGIAAFFPLGAYLFSIHNRLPAIIGLFFMILCLFIILSLKEVYIDKAKFSSKNYIKHIIRGLKYTFTNTNIKFLIFYSLIVFSVLDYIHSSWSLYLKEITIPLSMIGLVLAFCAIFTAFSSKYAYILDKIIGEKKSLFFGAIIFGLLVFLHSYLIPYWGVLIFILAAVVSGYLMVTVDSSINRYIESDQRATILSINNQVKAVCSALLFYTLGYVSMNFSFPVTYKVSSILLITLVLTLFLIYTVKNLFTVRICNFFN